jgi:hypothetical protein
MLRWQSKQVRVRHPPPSPTVHREVDYPDSPPFVRIPNELKLMFADYLHLDDINTPVRTARALNRLLTPFMYRRAKDPGSRNGYGRPYFLGAVKAGNLAAVRHFIEVGTSVCVSYLWGFFEPTALYKCVSEGYIEMAQLLIQHGVNMSPVQDFGDTPFHNAILGTSEDRWVRLLVDAGADIFASSADGETTLALATTCGRPSSVQLLLERGSTPTVRIYHGDTLLHCTEDGGSAETVGLLLEAGLNIETTNDLDQTPFHHTAKFHKIDYVSCCCQRGRMSTPSMSKDAPLFRRY